MMTIGFDAKRLFYNQTGLGNYSRSLIDGLNKFFPDIKCVLYAPDPIKSPYYEHFRTINSIISLKGSFNRSISLEKKWQYDDITLYHGLSHELPILRYSNKVPRIVTIHDLIHRTYPKDHKFHDRILYDLKIRNAVKKADIIICVSQHTASDLIEYYNVSRDRIRVVYQSVNPMFEIPSSHEELELIKNKYQLPEVYGLHISSIRPRKNLQGIVKAYRTLPIQDRIPMIVIGNGEVHKKYIINLLGEYKLRKFFIFKQAPWQDIKYLYDLAAFSLYPSFYEGFGIPVIESQWRKCPVIASNLSSIPEAGGQGALYINPYDPEAIAQAIQTILHEKNSSAELLAKAEKNKTKFSLATFAKNTASVYKDLSEKS